VTAAAATVSRRLPRARVPASIVVAIGVAWALSLAAAATGKERLLHQHGLVGHGPPLWAAALLFVVAWQAMLAAMMLPSSLPLIRLFAAAASRQEVGGRATAAFLGGYAAVWSAFGVAAFFADVAVHRLVDASSWLAPRPWLIGGSALLVAGAFQFSGLKDRCLQECRHPGPFLLANYRRGVRGGFRVGRKHGLFCLGCCWALMLVMFGLGVAVLWWMAALTALMVYEKTGRFGSAVARPAGVVLLAAAALQLAHPAWLPSMLGGSRAFATNARVGPAPIRAGAYELELGLVPAHAFRAGALSLQLSRRGHPLPGAGVRATFTMLDMDMPTVSASFAETGPGRYRASTPPLGMAGRWGLRVDVVPPHAARFTVSMVDKVGT
jgi:predicted metal-binding membrane protein